MKTESMSTGRIRRIGLIKGRDFASAAVLKLKLVCLKCDVQSFMKFAQHLPLASVNVW